MVKCRCPKCGEIIELDENSNLVKCPKCNQDIFFKEAYKKYQDDLVINVRKGDFYFNSLTDYKKAYKYYSEAFKLKENSLRFLFGVINSRLYTSTIHQNYIREVTDLLMEKSNNISIDSNNVLTLSDDLSKLREDGRKIVDFYKKYSNLSNYTKNNYINTLNDYKYFINKYIEIFNSLDKLNQYFKDNLEILNDEIKFVDDELIKDIKVINESDKKHEIVDQNNSIVNVIFVSTSKLFKLRMGFYIGMGVGIILIIIGLIMLSTNNKLASFILLSIGLVLFFVGYFVGHKIRSKQYNLNY